MYSNGSALQHLTLVTIATTTAFDSKPFIRTFESVLEELHQLRTRVQHQCNELESSAQAAEAEYKRNITDLHGAFDVSFWILYYSHSMLRHMYIHTRRTYIAHMIV